jgi:predicted RNA-binding protein with TRAM domain
VCSSSRRSEYNRVLVEAAREEPEEGVVHIQFDSEIGASNTAVEQPRSPPQSRSFFPKKGQDLELECESLAYKGLGVCKVVETGFVVFCERALPGERLVARIVKKRKGFAEVQQEQFFFFCKFGSALMLLH